MPVKNVPFLSFDKINSQTKPQIMKALEECFDSKRYVLGDNVTEFEKAYSKYNQVEHTVGVANGLGALHLSLVALGIKKGDEVILPSNTYIATVLAISYTGATPIFVEPCLGTCNIDPSKIEEKITSKTKVIIPVHLYGQACEMDQIMDIATKYNLFIVEDNAQAQGASFKGKLTGSFGDINATSFYPSKNLGALGDAGAITTNSEAIFNKCLGLRNYGSQKKYYNEVIGFNSRLDELQAAVLNVKLKLMNAWTEERQQIGLWYQEGLKDVNDIVLPEIAEGASHVFHLFTIRTENRNELQEHLRTCSIETLIHYPVPPHLQEAYLELGYQKGDFPIAELIADTTLSLPLFIGMTKDQVDFVCDRIKGFLTL